MKRLRLKMSLRDFVSHSASGVLPTVRGRGSLEWLGRDYKRRSHHTYS